MLKVMDDNFSGCQLIFLLSKSLQSTYMAYEVKVLFIISVQLSSAILNAQAL